MPSGYKRCEGLCGEIKHNNTFPRAQKPGKGYKGQKVCKECRKKQRQQGKAVKEE